MRKQKLLLFGLVCAVAIAGCKKKEPVDLSSLHTTAAVERETMPASTETPTAETKESSANDKSEDSQYSVKTEIKSLTEKNVSIEYPEISNMKDTEKQKQVNELIKLNAQAIRNLYPADKEGQSLSVKSTVESSNLKRITITYQGLYKDAATSKKFFYSNVIDLETIQSLRLSDYSDVYTVAGYIASGDYKLEEVTAADEKKIRDSINASGKTTDSYYKELGTSDFSNSYSAQGVAYTSQTWPKYFSYEKQGIVYISVPVADELGSYAIIRYSPDNK